jgi:hypothetical protein
MELGRVLEEQGDPPFNFTQKLTGRGEKRGVAEHVALL